MNGIERIEAERKRQIEQKGWTAEHDDEHTLGALAMNAAALAVWGTDAVIRHSDSDKGEVYDPWGLVKKHRGKEIRCLEIAGALIAAEIDRLLRRGISTAKSCS